MRPRKAVARRVRFKVWIQGRARVCASLLRFVCVARHGVVDATAPVARRCDLEPDDDPVEVQAVTSVNVIFAEAMYPHDALRKTSYV
jgi:hypothetical protein